MHDLLARLPLSEATIATLINIGLALLLLLIGRRVEHDAVPTERARLGRDTGIADVPGSTKSCK